MRLHLSWFCVLLCVGSVFPSEVCAQHYRPLADFVADIPWTRAGLKRTVAELGESSVRVVGLQSEDRVYCWLFHSDAGYENVVLRQRRAETVSDLKIDLAGLLAGTYRVEWWDTRSGKIVQQSEVVLTSSSLQLTVPPWQRDIACKVVRQR